MKQQAEERRVLLEGENREVDEDIEKVGIEENILIVETLYKHNAGE